MFYYGTDTYLPSEGTMRQYHHIVRELRTYTYVDGPIVHRTTLGILLGVLCPRVNMHPYFTDAVYELFAQKQSGNNYHAMVSRMQGLAYSKTSEVSLRVVGRYEVVLRTHVADLVVHQHKGGRLRISVKSRSTVAVEVWKSAWMSILQDVANAPITLYFTVRTMDSEIISRNRWIEWVNQCRT